MNVEPNKAKQVVESLLFVAREPLALEQLEEVMAAPREFLAGLMEELIADYSTKGIQIVKVAGGYLMGTNPDNAEYVNQILHPREETRLSAQALETLAIISYKQPVTRAEVERLRGVDSGYMIETLVAKKLVREAGRSEAAGRPYMYATSEDFLRHFGLQTLTDLPAMPTSEVDQENLFKLALQEN